MDTSPFLPFWPFGSPSLGTKNFTKDLPPPRQLVDPRKLYSAGVPLRCHGLNGHPPFRSVDQRISRVPIPKRKMQIDMGWFGLMLALIWVDLGWCGLMLALIWVDVGWCWHDFSSMFFLNSDFFFGFKGAEYDRTDKTWCTECTGHKHTICIYIR